MYYIQLLRINTVVNTDTLSPTQFQVTQFLTYAGKEWIKTIFFGGNESVMTLSKWKNTAGRWQAARKSWCGLSVSSVLCYEFQFKLHPTVHTRTYAVDHTYTPFLFARNFRTVTTASVGTESVLGMSEPPKQHIFMNDPVLWPYFSKSVQLNKQFSYLLKFL